MIRRWHLQASEVHQLLPAGRVIPPGRIRPDPADAAIAADPPHLEDHQANLAASGSKASPLAVAWAAP
jgi:hypothetical protein